STTALYVFHTMAKVSVSDTTVYPEVNIVCSFDANQLISCWAGDNDYLTGDASKGTGLMSQNGHLQIFAGPRNDPFFFNMSAFNTTAATIKTALMMKSYGTPDAAGCLTVPPATSLLLKSSLAAGGMDSFQGKNVLAIAVSVARSVVTTPQHQ